MKILVVDDDEIIVNALDEKLTKNGFQVEKAYDGEQALEKIRQQIPDLIILDLIMPVKDGNEVLNELKESDQTKDIPVVILTNLPEEKKPIQVLESNMPYLVKVDHSLDEIISRVKSELKMQ